MKFFYSLLLCSIFSLQAFSSLHQTHLYELEYQGTKSNLFGTYHGTSFTKLPQAIRKIIESRHVLITENTDVLQPLTKSRIEQMGCLKLAGQDDYINALTKDNIIELEKFVKPFLLFKNSEVTIRELNLKGLYATYIAGHSIEGMDYHLIQYFHNRSEDTSILGLENSQQVATFFEELTLDELQHTLECKAGFESSAAEQEEIKYLQGIEYEIDETFSVELEKRNINWMPKILEYHKTLDKGIFCVGVSHLYGKQGLLNLLKEKEVIIKRADSQGTFRLFQN